MTASSTAVRSSPLPTTTCWCCFLDSHGKPQGACRSLNGGGPPPNHLAADHVSHGGPPPMPRTCPARMRSFHHATLVGDKRSPLSYWLLSRNRGTKRIEGFRECLSSLSVSGSSPQGFSLSLCWSCKLVHGCMVHRGRSWCASQTE